MEESEIKQDLNIPVIAIDGGAGTGKGAVRSIVARELAYHELDSGTLYRSVALLSLEKDITDSQLLTETASNLKYEMRGEKVFLFDKDITKEIRSDRVSKRASEISQMKEVRHALKKHELSMRILPGLVADGRDMHAVFDTPHKFFLVASPEVRARRRVLQFESMGHPANYDDILKEILNRDEVDRTREHSPMIAHAEATIINVDTISAKEVADVIIKKSNLIKGKNKKDRSQRATGF